MDNSELRSLYNKYKTDPIVSILYSELMKIDELEKESKRQILDESLINTVLELKRLRSKTTIAIARRVAEIKQKNKLVMMGVICIFLSFLSIGYTTYINFYQTMSSSKLRSELYETLSEQIEQAFQLEADKIQKNIRK